MQETSLLNPVATESAGKKPEGSCNVHPNNLSCTENGVSRIHGKQEWDGNGKREWERPTENA